VLGSIASIALPALGALIAGPIGLGGTLGAAGGAAAGSALSGTLQGQGIGDILKNAALAGATTFAGGELMKGIGGVGAAPGSSFSQAFSPEFMASIAEGAVPSAIGGAAGSLAGDGITVIGSKLPSLVSGVSGGIGGLAANQLGNAPAVGEEPGITVSAPKPTPLYPAGTLGVIGGGLLTPQQEALLNQAESGELGTDKKGLSTLDKIRLGLLGANLASKALGGGGSDRTVGDTGGPLSYKAMDRTQATPGFDVFTYGQDLPGAQKGEFQFFTPAAAPAAAKLAEGGDVDSEPSDDMVKHLLAYQRGGGHMGPGQVKGIGSGQDDKIPAWLSDGEYVWSAQDVADLGDGSTDEGVRRLDKMRQMVRKQAGRKDVKKIAKPQKGIDHMLKAVGGRV